MSSVTSSPSTRLSIGSSQAPSPPRDDSTAALPGALPVDCSVSLPPAPVRETAPGLWPVVAPAPGGSSSLSGSLDSWAGVGVNCGGTNAALPSCSGTHPQWTSAESMHGEGKGAARAFAANLTQASICDRSGCCSVAMQPSTRASLCALHDVPGTMSVTALDFAYTARYSAQLKLAAAPSSAATAAPSVLPYTSAARCSPSSPPARHSAQARHWMGGSSDRTRTGGCGGDQLSSPFADPTAAVLSSSSSSSPLPVYSLCCAGASAAVPTAASPSVASAATVAARMAAIGLGNTGSGALVYPREASLPTLRSLDSEAAAAAVEFADGQQQQLQSCHLQASSGAPAEVSVVADICEENGGTENDRSDRQSRPCGSTSSFGHASRARPPLAESGKDLPGEYGGHSARQNARLSHDVSRTSVCGADNSAPGTFLMRCEDEGSFAPESVRARSDADRTTCAVAGHRAKTPRGDTADDFRMLDFIDFGALDEAVAAMASVTAATGATAQPEGDGAAAQSSSSSLPTLSQELQRTLPPSAVIAAGDHCQDRGQQPMMHMPPSQSLEMVYAETLNTRQQRCCPSPVTHPTSRHLSDRCSGTLYEADDFAELSVSATPLRPHASISSFALPPRSASGATQRPSTPLPNGACAHGKGSGEELADAAVGCAHGSEALSVVAADSLSSLSPLTESSSRLRWAASLLQRIHGRHTTSMATTSSFRAHPLSPVPVAAPSAAALAAPPGPTALPARQRGTPRRLATRPVEGSGFRELKLPATAPAETSVVQGRSPRTPRSQRESHLLSQVRVALTDARSVRSHLHELKALLPAHRTHSAAAASAHDVKHATASAEGARRMGRSGAAGNRARSDDCAGFSDCTTAMSPLGFSLLPSALGEGKADGVGGGHRSRMSCEGCSGDSSTPQARAITGRTSSQLQSSQGLHHSSSDMDADGDDGGRSLAATFNVRGLYTSSLNSYRHQRLKRLTEQHLRSLWFGISAVAKSVCGVTVGQCVQMHLAQSPAWVGEQAQRFPCDMAAATAAAASVTPLLVNSSLGAAPQQLRRSAPSSVLLTPLTSPTPRSSTAPSGAVVSAQDAEAAAPKKAFPCALKQPPPGDPPDPESFSQSSGDPLATGLAEGETFMGGEQALATAATVEVEVQRLADTERGDPPSDRHPDFQRRSLDEVALLDSVSVGGNVSASVPPSARTAVLGTATNSSAFTCTRSEECVSLNSRSSAVLSTALKARTGVPANTSSVEAHCTNSDRYRCSDSSYSSRHHSTALLTTLSKWSNVPTPGTAHIHNTRKGPISAAAVPGGSNDGGGSSGRRVHSSSCSGTNAREGGGGSVVGAAGGARSGLSRPATPTTATTAPTGGGGPPLYTLPSTLLLQQQQQQSQDSSSLSAPSASIGGATPSSWHEPPPIATLTHRNPPLHQSLPYGCDASAPLTALPHHNSSSTWNSGGGGTPPAHAEGSTSCPSTGGAPGSMWMLPPPSPAPPPPPAADHRGAVGVAASGASGLSVASPRAPSVLSGSSGAASVGVGAGASAVQRVYTRSSGAASVTPLTSSSGLALMSSLLAAVPTPPVKASFIKVEREEVAADTTPGWDSNARASGARVTAAAVAAVATTAIPTSSAGHAQGECQELSPTSSTLSLTGHKRPGGGGAGVRSGVATGCDAVAAATIPMEAREDANNVLHSVDAAVTPLPASVSSCSMLDEGEPSVAPVLRVSMESIARDIHGSSDTPASPGATLVTTPDSLLPRPGEPEALSSSPLLEGASAGAAVPAAGLAPFASNVSSEGVEGLCSSFWLRHPTATPWSRERLGMSPSTKTATAATTSTSSYITGSHASAGGAKSCSLPSSSASQRPPPLLSPANVPQCDALLHNDQPLANTATDAREGEAESAALPSATEQALPESQKHHTKGEEEPTRRWGAQALPLLRFALVSLDTTRATSTPSSPATSALSAEDEEVVEDHSESDDAAAAVKASDRLLAHAVAEGPRMHRTLHDDVRGGTGAAARKSEFDLCLGFPTTRASTSSLPSPRPRGQGDHDVASVDAPPRAASATSSSLSYTTISASTAEATSAVVTAMAVAGTRVPFSAPSAPLAPLRAERQPRHWGDGRSLTHSVPTSDFRLHDMCDEGASAIGKQSRSGSAAADRASHTPPRGAVRGGKRQDRSSHVAPSPVKSHLLLTPASVTASLAVHSSDSADALPTQTEDKKDEVIAISARICAASPPVHPCSRVIGTQRSPPHSSAPTTAVSAQAERTHVIPATEAEVCEADASAAQVTGGTAAADTSGAAAPSPSPRSCSTRGGGDVVTFIDSVPGAAAALEREQSGSLNPIGQPPDMSHTIAHTHSHIGEHRGGIGEAKGEKVDVTVGEIAAGEGEDGRDVLSLDAGSDAHDLMSSSRHVSMHHQARQRQQCHQHPLMQRWSSLLTISSSGHSAAATSSLRATITGMTLGASVAALGSRLSGSSTMTPGTSTALASVAEAILGFSAAGSAGGGGSYSGGPSAHTAVIPSIGTASTTPAAAEAAAAAAAASFTVTMIASATAAAGSSSWTPNSTVTLSSASASIAGSTSLSTVLGTTVSSSASYSLSPERHGSILSSGAGGGVTAEAPSVLPAVQGEKASSLTCLGAKAPWQAENTAPVAMPAAGATAAAVGGSGDAACDADVDAFGLDAALNSTLDFASRRSHVLSQLKALPPLPPPQNYPFLLPEVSSPRLRNGDGGFEEDEDNVVTDGDAQNIDAFALLDANSDPKCEERRCAAALVPGGSNDSSCVETPRCGETDGADSAHSGRSAEDHGAVAKLAESPTQHHCDGKVNAKASPVHSPLEGRTDEITAVTEAAALTAVAAVSVAGAYGGASACSSDERSESGGGGVSSNAAGEASPRGQTPPLPLPADPSTRTATTDDSGAVDTSPHAVGVPREALKQALRAGRHDTDEDGSTAECSTSPTHLSVRAPSTPTARLPTSVDSCPTATTATETSAPVVSAIEGNEAVRTISCPRSGDSVPRAPSSPLLCATNASAASRLPHVSRDSPLRQRGASAITPSGDALMSSMTTTATRQTAGAAIADTAATTAVERSVGTQTCRRESRLHYLSVDASALSQGSATASSSNRNHRDVGCRLSQRKATPPPAVVEVGGLMPLSREAALGRSSWRADVRAEFPLPGAAEGAVPSSPSRVPQERRSPRHGNVGHEIVVAGAVSSQRDLPSQWLLASAGSPSDDGGAARACECHAQRVFMGLRGSGGVASGDGVAAVSVDGGDAIDQAAAEEEDDRAQMVTTAVSEDATTALITALPPATQPFWKRQTCWSDPIASPLRPVVVRDKGGVETLRDGGGFGPDSVVAEAVQTASAASLFDSGVIDQTNRACADDIGDRVVDKDETSAALESRSRCSGTCKGFRATATTTVPAQGSHNVESCGAEGAAAVVMVTLTREPTGEELTSEAIAARTAAAAAPTASWHPSPPSSPTLCPADAPPALICPHEGPSRRLPLGSLSSAPTSCVDGDGVAMPRSAEKEHKRRHDDSHAVDANAMMSPAALDSTGALPIACRPLATTSSLQATGALSSHKAVSRHPSEAASCQAPEEAPSTKLSSSRELPPLPLPQARLSIPSHYLAQCEDGLADVTGSPHGWHAESSAFFFEAVAAAPPGRAHSTWSGPSAPASDRYTPLFALARRRAQQRARYHVASLSGAAAPSCIPATAAVTPLSASAMPVLSSRGDATADRSERLAAAPTSPSSTAASLTHNDRLLALMKFALQYATGDGGT
ncbi:hypothetical protein GH5_08435 [Leishmania sp. Ghana 2012 LV757]|uniref:hypothetical protein n=1 Tax=Leishmania sp. Ghana 2012 LV757 TaxID=2803181 RepID=UPI001B481FBA|nr:hypothetical protein GH5_08435 [Leishmania sp. Ghana 2012 LV757]